MPDLFVPMEDAVNQGWVEVQEVASLDNVDVV